MNKRVEEIASRLNIQRDKYGLYFSGDSSSDGIDLEEFAKLIIEKCGEIADDYVDHGIPSSAIDKYFGV